MTTPFPLYFLITFCGHPSLVAADDFCLPSSLLQPALFREAGTGEFTRLAVTMTVVAVTVLDVYQRTTENWNKSEGLRTQPCTL